MSERLVYIGSNPDNASGWSAKFWRLDPIPGNPDQLRATWGKIGTAGQSKVYGRWEGEAKLHEKLRKGYQRATGGTVAPRPAARTFAERVVAATFQTVTIERLVNIICAHALVEATTVDGYRVFVGDAGGQWAVKASGDRWLVAAV